MIDGSGGRADGPDKTDKARDEFLSEAQELVDAMGRDLMAFEDLLKRGQAGAEQINDVFRAVHTLKGLSGLFGATRMSSLSHQLEDVLDDLRLGRTEATAPVLDLLFQAVALYGRILASEKGDGAEPGQEVDRLLVELGQISTRPAGAGADVTALYGLDPGLLGVLTEYEEHRLRANIEQGLDLFRIRAKLPLATIDLALEELKTAAKPHGEIITYLPTGTGVDADVIELEILIASRAELGLLRAVVERPNVTLEAVPRRSSSPSRFPPPVGRPTLPPGPTSSALAASHSAPPPALLQHKVAAVQVGAGAPAEVSLRSVTQTVRVDIRKLDRLMTVVGELAILKTAIARLTERARRRAISPQDLAVDLQRLSRTFERHLSKIQGGILEVRMVPLGQVFDKLARVVRQILREHEKEVSLVVTGAETEIDKLIVEELSDPLMHIIRNAIAHGIEPKDDRLSVGKPAVGTIALNAFQKGNHVVIEIEDDGVGMDPSNLVAAAVRRGIVSEDEAKELTPREIVALVFLPGFTTTETATSLSGRGMGLDVVKTNMGKLGGVVDIESEVGIGTKITITLPVTLAIISVLLVQVRGKLFAIPVANVEEAIDLEPGRIRTVEAKEVLSVRGTSLPLVRLETLFAMSGDPSPAPASYVVIARVANRRLGLVVDGLVGQEDIVIKPLAKSLASVRGFSGATELGDQRVALVVDVAAIVEEALAPWEARFLAAVGAEDGPRRPSLIATRG